MSENIIEAPKRRGPLYAIVAAVVAVLVIAGFLIFGGGGSDAKGKTVKIGVVGAGDPYWATYVEAAADEGIAVELVDFADYTQPNPALTEGELDLNQFQHIVYLAKYNVAVRRRPHADRLDRDLPARALLRRSTTTVDDIPDGRDRRRPRRRQQPGPRPARAAVGRPHRAQGRRHDLLDLADVDTGESKVQGQGARCRADRDLAARRRRRDHQQRLRRATPASTFDDAIAQDDPRTRTRCRT